MHQRKARSRSSNNFEKHRLASTHAQATNRQTRDIQRQKYVFDHRIVESVGEILSAEVSIERLKQNSYKTVIKNFNLSFLLQISKKYSKA